MSINPIKIDQDACDNMLNHLTKMFYLTQLKPEASEMFLNITRGVIKQLVMNLRIAEKALAKYADKENWSLDECDANGHDQRDTWSTSFALCALDDDDPDRGWYTAQQAINEMKEKNDEYERILNEQK